MLFVVNAVSVSGSTVNLVAIIVPVAIVVVLLSAGLVFYIVKNQRLRSSLDMLRGRYDSNTENVNISSSEVLGK